MITFTLVDTVTSQDVRVLTNGTTVTAQEFSIRVDVNAKNVKSIRFGLDDNPNFRIENQVPYSLVGDEAGIYRPWKPSPGLHTVSATPYSGINATGQPGNTKKVVFTVTKEGAITPQPQAKPDLDLPSGLLFLGNFETGGLSGWRRELCCSESAQVVSNPVRSGKYAVQFKLSQSDRDVQGSKRSELALGNLKTPANAERWYGFSTYLPDSYTADPSSEVVVQWHNEPDFALGETWRTPALALKTIAGRWQLSNRWDPNPVTYKNTPGAGGGKEDSSLGPYGTNQWTDWVFHIKWSSGSDGLVEVWKNGTSLLRKVGPNTYNDQKGPFLKVGIYKPDWKYRPAQSTTTQRQIYMDELRIGDQTTSYTQVAPRP